MRGDSRRLKSIDTDRLYPNNSVIREQKAHFRASQDLKKEAKRELEIRLFVKGPRVIADEVRRALLGETRYIKRDEKGRFIDHPGKW